jgi:hypothetical protein
MARSTRSNGPPSHRHVVIMLTPEVSGEMLPAPTTVSLALEDVKRVAPAA